MKFLIKNLAKIKEANIEIDGITVICGNNNTGKSTVGKALFAVFESNLNIEEKIKKEIISNIFYNIIRPIFVITNFDYFNKLFNKFLKEINYPNIVDSKDIKNDIMDFIKEIVKKDLSIIDYAYNDPEHIQWAEHISKKIKNDEKTINETINKIYKVITTSYKELMKEIITRYFSYVFNTQINNLYEENSISDLVLEIKKNKFNIKFQNNKCIDINEQIYINNNIYYIDNPFIIDKMNTYNKKDKYTLIEKKLLDSLTKDYSNDMFENIIDSVQNKEILTKISNLLDNDNNDDVNGKINFIGGFYYLDKVRFENLSTGIKSFLIIRMILRNGVLKEKDLLVLDEPEIHLHPEWQLLYAETIVLLQKYLDLTITITTHSPYFLEAINAYSKLHKIHNRVNFYFAEADKNNDVTINNVNDNINLIFKKMADPLKKLRNMRIEEFDNSKSEE